jgi:hypothetical protein
MRSPEAGPVVGLQHRRGEAIGAVAGLAQSCHLYFRVAPLLEQDGDPSQMVEWRAAKVRKPVRSTLKQEFLDAPTGRASSYRPPTPHKVVLAMWIHAQCHVANSGPGEQRDSSRRVAQAAARSAHWHADHSFRRASALLLDAGEAAAAGRESG